MEGRRESASDVIPLPSSWSRADHVTTFLIRITGFGCTPCSVAGQLSAVCPIERLVCLTVES